LPDLEIRTSVEAILWRPPASEISIPRVANSVLSLKMPDHPSQVVEAFVTAVRNLTSDDSYKAVEGVFEEIPRLKGQIESKDTELGHVRKEAGGIKTKYETRLQDELELYRTRHNKLEEEKDKLAANISTHTATIQQRDKTVAELNRVQDELKRQLGLLKKSLGEEAKKVTNANAEITELQQSLKAKDAEVDKLKDSLRNEKSKVSDTEHQLRDLGGKNIFLQQDLRAKTTKLKELEGFTTELHEGDDGIW
jgi:chromosome segregation ATPase